MAKPKIPNQKKKYQELNARLNRYVALVEQIYDTLNLEAAKVVSRTNYSSDSEKPFKWSDYPQTRKQVDDIQARFVEDISAVIYRGTSEEWKNSNEVQDLMTNKVLKAYNAQVDKEKYKVLYQTNPEALEAFRKRKDKGLNISTKLWNQSILYKEELEAAISCAIQKGTSAITLSKQISKYMIDFTSLQKEYKNKYGNAEHLKDCEYRSIRLARSEINMAYRAAENERWKQMDFVVGYEIKLSHVHHQRMPHGDICDTLAGKYPKDFVWTGWHPNDLCYKVPILKTEEEFWEWDGRSEPTTESVNEVKDVPDAFKQWVGTNAYRIEESKKRGTLPYFIRDNQKAVERILEATPMKEYYMPTNVNADARKLWVDNAVSIEKKLGITQGKPMTFDEANELRGNINFIPKYITGNDGKKIANPGYSIENDKYHVNCQSCVVANELRRRGYDVTALPNLRSKGNAPYELSLKTESGWMDPDTGETPKKSIYGRKADNRGNIIAKPYKETMHDLMESMKEPGRYHVNFKWKGKDNGHIITFERARNGTIQWYDPQTGNINFFDKEYYNRIHVSKGIYVLRVDNLMVNTEIIDGIVEGFKK